MLGFAMCCQGMRCSLRVSSHCPIHVGINEGLRALGEGGVPPKLLIIDDGWQTTELDASLRPPPSQEEVLRAEQEVRGRFAASPEGSIPAS